MSQDPASAYLSKAGVDLGGSMVLDFMETQPVFKASILLNTTRNAIHGNYALVLKVAVKELRKVFGPLKSIDGVLHENDGKTYVAQTDHLIVHILEHRHPASEEILQTMNEFLIYCEKRDTFNKSDFRQLYSRYESFLVDLSAFYFGHTVRFMN